MPDVDNSIPNGWDAAEWFEYQDYLSSLTPEEYEGELAFIKTAAECKRQGKNFVAYTSQYDC